ncbi:MAG: outer membrane beta-barrel protein [Gemmatimonadales bacterium]
MNRFIFSAVAAAAAIAVVGPQARAQGYNPFQIGASGGIAFPTSDLGNVANTGYNIAFAVGYKPLGMPIGLRAEAAYNEFGLQGGNGNINVPAFTANATFDLPAAGFTPYAIGGAGLYRPAANSAFGSTATENHFGFNVGGGVKIPLSSSFETFIEARYNRVSMNNGSLSFVPVTVGIMW